jgi:hypothetical protein
MSEVDWEQYTEISKELNEILQNHEWNIFYDALKRQIQMMDFVVEQHNKKHNNPVKVKPVGDASGTMHIEKQMSDVKKYR